MITTTFIQSGTPVSFSPADFSAPLTLPTIDGSNTDLLITSTCGGQVFLTFGAAVALGDNRLRGEVVVPPNSTGILLTATPATAAASAANPAVVFLTTHATAAAVSVIAAGRGGQITITRGTATPRNTF